MRTASRRGSFRVCMEENAMSQTARKPYSLEKRSPEHEVLTPVFGTACLPNGVSGLIRCYASTLSEGRLAQWLLLAGADRVDVLESRVSAALRGVLIRADQKRQQFDPLVYFTGTAAVGFGLFFLCTRARY